MLGKVVAMLARALLLLIALAAFPVALLAPAAHHAAPAADAMAPASTMRGLLERHPTAGLAPLPAGLDAQQRMDYILHHPAAGRSPQEWLDWAHGALRLDAPAAPRTGLTLDAAVLKLYAAAGIAPAAQDLAAAHAAALTVPLPAQGGLASLVDAVAQAYAGQRGVADAVAQRPHDLSLLPAERDASAERAARLTAAIAAAQADLPLLATRAMAGPTCLAPVLADCLAYLGSSGDDAYPYNPAPLPDPILILDPAGNDTYTDSAAGANPAGTTLPGNGLALSVVADLAGDDRYAYTGEPAAVQGAGYAGGLGLLVDRDGDDTYLANFTRSTSVPPTLTTGGNVVGNSDGGAQGYGYAGVGILLDAWGSDLYDFRLATTNGLCAWGWVQGFGGAGGLGVASDLWGDDRWLATGRGTSGGDDCWGAGTTDAAILGIYAQAVGVLGGVGLLTDTGQGGDDYHVYDNSTTPDVYGQGYGLISGLGILADDGGADDVVSSETATATGIGITINCAFGSGQGGGVGVMLFGPGDTRYLTDTTSNGVAESMSEGWGGAGYGLFVDQDGTDQHLMQASGSSTQLAGRGDIATSANTFGTYLDLGGDPDTYVGPPFSYTPLGAGTDPNDSVWVTGADL
jgi:hypothetical protein